MIIMNDTQHAPAAAAPGTSAKVQVRNVITALTVAVAARFSEYRLKVSLVNSDVIVVTHLQHKIISLRNNKLHKFDYRLNVSSVNSGTSLLSHISSICKQNRQPQKQQVARI